MKTERRLLILRSDDDVSRRVAVDHLAFKFKNVGAM